MQSKRLTLVILSALLAWPALGAPATLPGADSGPLARARAAAEVQGLRADLLDAAEDALSRHGARLRRTDRIVIVDYALPSRAPRLFVVETATGRIAAFHVTHGQGSDPDHDGRLNAFDARPGKYGSMRGAYRGGERYVGKHGASLRLDGLEPDNANARERAIVVHAAPSYASPQILRRLGKLGRSQGCFTVFESDLEDVMSALENGALLYVEGPAPG